jgi:hypothetical protein
MSRWQRPKRLRINYGSDYHSIDSHKVFLMRIPEDGIAKEIRHNQEILSDRALRRPPEEETSGISNIYLSLDNKNSNNNIKGNMYKTFIKRKEFSLTKCRIAKFPFLRCDLGGRKMRNDVRALRSWMELFFDPPRLCTGTSEIILPSSLFRETSRYKMAKCKQRSSWRFNSSLLATGTLGGIR